MKFRISIGRAMIIFLGAIMLFGMMPSFAQDLQPGNDMKKGKLLYEENFTTSKGSVWDGFLDANFSCYFENGKYHLAKSNRMNDWRSISVGDQYGDFMLQVEATQEAGPDDNAYGVIFRKVDWGNYYSFLISGDGYYRVGKLINRTWEKTGWNNSSAIHTGNATNLIGVQCAGNKIACFINGEKVTEYTDESFSRGMFGLTVGTNYGRGAVTIGFDNLNIWEIYN